VFEKIAPGKIQSGQPNPPWVSKVSTGNGYSLDMGRKKRWIQQSNTGKVTKTVIQSHWCWQI